MTGRVFDFATDRSTVSLFAQASSRGKDQVFKFANHYNYIVIYSSVPRQGQDS